MFEDVKGAVRSLARARGLTLLAVLTLAVGIGANTGVFSLVNALLLRRLPVASPETLVRVDLGGSSHASHPNFRDLSLAAAQEGSGLAGVAAHRLELLSLGDAAGGEGQRVMGELVSGSYFPLLGVAPARGRTFEPSVDARVGAAPEVVVSDRFWKGRLGAREDVLGTPLLLNGQSYTVVGVMPPRFSGTHAFALVPDVYLPLSMYPVVAVAPAALEERRRAVATLVVRLAPGLPRAQGVERIRALAGRLQEAHPDENRGFERTRVKGLDGLDAFGGEGGPGKVVLLFLGVLTGLVALVLLIACANLANLLLARAVNRKKEVAIRAALGAGRGQLLRLFLTESVLLSLAGGAAGVLFAAACARAVPALVPALPVPLALDVGMDGAVLGYTLALSLLTGLLFGLMPALHASRPDLAVVLKEAVAREGRGRRFSLRSALVVAQVAASLVLLVCAGLFLRSLQAAGGVDPGFDTRGVLTATVDLSAMGLQAEQARGRFEGLRTQLEGLPGVEAASVARVVPLSLNTMESQYQQEGSAPDSHGVDSHFNVVGPRYFEVMRIPLLAGREVLPSDGADAPRVVVVNETFARRAWPGESPLGKRVRTSVGRGTWGAWAEVVGLVRDSKVGTPGEDPQAVVYEPAAQSDSVELTLHLRTAGPPEALAGPVRQALRQVDGRLVPEVKPIREWVALSLLPAQVASGLLGTLGVLGLLLASLGLYGVVSYTTAQRTHELGVRLALGARPADLVRLVLGQGLGLTAAGVAVGLLLSLGAATALGSLLTGVGPFDAPTLLAASGLLALVAGLASYAPARRALRVDPMVSLRSE
jgi:predicted permease